MGKFCIAVTGALIVCTSCYAQRAKVIKWPQLQAVMTANPTEIKVVNFWATWCGPCVKELPQFEALHQKQKKINVILVSMDMDLDSDTNKVQSFIGRKKITCPVYILDDQNANGWIEKIDASWSGALPATLIINQQTNKRIFLEREIHEGELNDLISQVK